MTVFKIFLYYIRRKCYRKSPNENNIGQVSFLSEPGFGCHSIMTTCHLSFFFYKCLGLFFSSGVVYNTSEISTSGQNQGFQNTGTRHFVSPVNVYRSFSNAHFPALIQRTVVNG